tara:strand:- start:1898 stop:2821 length:924 start_codon:yes stop_codon:yes gene_type:complete
MRQKILIIGSGYMAYEYIKAISKYFNNSVISIVTESEVRANELCEEFDLHAHYVSIDKLKLADYSKIIVCTSENKFLNIAKQIKNFTGEVLFEKPLGLSIEESKKIAQMNKNNFYVALNRRFYEGIYELKKFIGNLLPKHGIILDQQSLYEWNPRRLQSINNELVYANSVHIIDLTFYILSNSIQINQVHSQVSESQNKHVSNHKIRISDNPKTYINYTRHNNIPGKWQIMLFFEEFLVIFENLENYKVLSPSREVLLSSPSYKDDIKQGLKPMLDIFLNESKNNFKSLPLAIDCIDLFKIVNNLRL